MSDDPWKYTRDCIANGTYPISFQWVNDTGIPGTRAVIATISPLPYAIGEVIYRQQTKSNWAILWMQTIDPLRRLGICKKIHDEIVRVAGFNGISELYTQATTDASKGLICKAGYKQKKDGLYLPVKAAT